MAKLNVQMNGDVYQTIERSIAYMLGHLNERIKVVDLARMANLSAAHFTALFKQKTGHPPINFIIRLRMHQACHLLKINNLSVREIAATLGYKDPFFFSRQFKMIHGVAPKNYRMLETNVVPFISRISVPVTAPDF